jgi:hypothetical protein
VKRNVVGVRGTPIVLHEFSAPVLVFHTPTVAELPAARAT